MDKSKFDKIMDDWVAREMEAAPDLTPSPEVYKKLEEKKKKPRFALFSWPVRLAAAGIAAALIILVIVLQPPKEVGPFVELRKGSEPEIAGKVGEEETDELQEDVAEPERAKLSESAEERIKAEKTEKEGHEKPPAETKTTAKKEMAKEADKEAFVQTKEVAARARMELKPEKKKVESGAKRSQLIAAAPAVAVSERIEFQYQPKGSEAIEGVDLSLPRDETISLSSEDNYRIHLQLPQKRYVYVYQVGAARQIIRLFPNTEYNPSQNPLDAGKTIIIPLPPNWFYVEKDAGEVLIYVVTSAEPLQEWDEKYAGYSRSENKVERNEFADELLDQIERDKRKPEDQVSVKVFKFDVRGSIR